MTKGVYLLLGSNMGDKRQQLITAINEISKSNQVIRVSSVYKTEAWGQANQPAFYNQVIQVQTSFSPKELLDHVLEIEAKMGRIRTERWGQRVIDIDILYYNDMMINTEDLTIPHPEIQHRRFTLIPLVEIAAEFTHPSLLKNQQQLLSICNDRLDVELV